MGSVVFMADYLGPCLLLGSPSDSGPRFSGNGGERKGGRRELTVGLFLTLESLASGHKGGVGHRGPFFAAQTEPEGLSRDPGI